MKLSTSRKAYLVLLGLAVTAFLVDRLFLGGPAAAPQQARASVDAGRADRTAPAAQPQHPPARAASEADAQSLAHRLAALAGSEGFDPASVGDAFAPSKVWLSRPQAARAATQPSAAQRFPGAHRLTSVVLAGGRGWAIVDAKVVQIGQQLDGFTLVGLTHDRAVFQAGQDRVELKLHPETTP